MTDERGAKREAALELLRNQHTFPGDFVFRIVVRPTEATSVVSVVAAALGARGDVLGVQEQPSSGGRYLSLRIRAMVPEPEAVLEVYEVVAVVDGVIMML